MRNKGLADSDRYSPVRMQVRGKKAFMDSRIAADGFGIIRLALDFIFVVDGFGIIQLNLRFVCMTHVFRPRPSAFAGLRT